LEVWAEAVVSDTLFPDRQPSGTGILPSQEIRDFIDTGVISSAIGIEDDQIQPSSIDLRLSEIAYRVQASFLPGRSTTLENKAKSNGMFNSQLDISKPTLLERNVIYIIPLMESLHLPSDVYGIANPKSTTGRLDIFTRLITETGDEFERVRKGYAGRLYIEVMSQSFPIIVRAGMKLNQLRFCRGKLVPTGDSTLRQLDTDDPFTETDPDGSTSGDEPELILRGLRLTVDLKGNGSDIVAYRAKRNTPPVDLGKIDFYETSEFWHTIYRDERLILEPGEFYILASKQRVRVKPEFAVEMLPYDLATQEFRVHYAGFFDPGFGYGMHGEIPATKAVLEVRATQMPILLEDNQFVGRLHYYKMSQIPNKIYGGGIGSSYQLQGLALSKQFKREPQYISRTALPAVLPASVHDRLSNSVDEEEEDSTQVLSFPDHGIGQPIHAKDR
jgi:dCTP deaminase